MDLLAEEINCAFLILPQAKSLSLICGANKGLQALECLFLDEEVSQVCPGSIQGSSFLLPKLVVKTSLYLILSRKVYSK